MPLSLRRPSPGRCTPAALALASCLVAPAFGQGYWRTAAATPIGPSDRYGASFVFDERAGVALLYGGSNLAQSFAELWRWDGATWQLLDASALPGPREFHAMSYDAARGTSVMFGGTGWTGPGVTWEWDTATLTWTQHSPATTPLNRWAAAMVYDAARGVHVLFGGERGNTKLDETWEWDGVNWAQRSFAVAPPARSAHAMVYDSTRRRVVLFGGQGPALALSNDLWEYDGAAWVEIAQGPAPAPRAAHAMVVDSQRDVVVLWGGEEVPFAHGTAEFPETWEWDGVRWSEVVSLAEPDRAAACMFTFDPVRGEAVLFGGHPGSSVSQTLLYASAGTNYCPAQPNSTGQPGRIGTAGSPVVANDDLTLWAAELPTHVFGYFLTGPNQGFVAQARGSLGNLCVAGAIGRFIGPGQVQSSGAHGAFTLALELERIPTPGGTVAVVAGETRSFQAWYRDSSQGAAASNFTDGVTVRFR